jgi:hypothetical protein
MVVKPYYLFLYLDALVGQDAHLVSDFADFQLNCTPEHATHIQSTFRASNYYGLEQVFKVCKERDLVPEIVFLLGKMGHNKQALISTTERLGDVSRR